MPHPIRQTTRRALRASLLSSSISALLACGDSTSTGSPAGDAATADAASSTADTGTTGHMHDASGAPHDAASTESDGSSAADDAGAKPDAAQDASTPTDAASDEVPDASAECVSYCACMATSCADVQFARGCLAECATQTNWDLACRQGHCGLQPPEIHCKHAHGVEQCFDR